MPHRIMLLLLPLMLGLLIGLGGPGRAQAQTCSATVTDVDFGQPDVTSITPTDVLATLNVTCTHIPFLTVVKLCPNLGDGSGGDNGSARLLNIGSGGSLSYQFYQDASRTQGWGSIDETALGTVPSILLSGGTSGTATASRTIYARLFGSQSAAAPGFYTSTFAGNETAFGYSTFLLGASSNCTGFVGATTIRPEFDVLAEIAAYCRLTATDLDFGSVGVIQSPLNAQSTLRVTCAPKTPFALSLDGGLTGAQPGARKMSLGAEAITYGLYRDSARTALWGDTAATRASGTGTGADQGFVVYGRVPIQNAPRPGVYSDRIVATVTY